MTRLSERLVHRYIWSDITLADSPRNKNVRAPQSGAQGALFSADNFAKIPLLHTSGEVPERPIGPVSKTGVGAISPRVRIPPSPLQHLSFRTGPRTETILGSPVFLLPSQTVSYTLPLGSPIRLDPAAANLS